VSIKVLQKSNLKIFLIIPWETSSLAKEGISKEEAVEEDAIFAISSSTAVDVAVVVSSAEIFSKSCK
jgi:hypothetical protein